MTRAKVHPINSRWDHLPVEIQNKIRFHAAEKNFNDKAGKYNQAAWARREAMITPDTRNLSQRIMGLFRPSRRDRIQAMIQQARLEYDTARKELENAQELVRGTEEPDLEFV